MSYVICAALAALVLSSVYCIFSGWEISGAAPSRATCIFCDALTWVAVVLILGSFLVYRAIVAG